MTRPKATKYVPLGRWGTKTSIAERVKIPAVLYHGAQMFPWAWQHRRGVGWFSVFVFWWYLTGGWVAGLVLLGVTYGLTFLLGWQRSRGAGAPRGSLTGYVEERKHKALLEKNWPGTCVAVGLIGKHTGEAPKLEKVQTRPGTIEATVVMAAAGIPTSELVKHSSEIADLLRCEDVIVTQTGPGVARIVFHFKDAIGRILPLAELPVAPKGKVAYGVQSNGMVAAFQMRLSVLFGGLTEHGKSNLIHAAIASLLRDQIPIWLYISDPKGGMEMGEYGKHLGEKNGNLTIKGYASTPAESEKMLELVHKNMLTRQRVFAERGLRSWEPSAENPLVVVICDELLELPDTLKKGSGSHLAGIVRLGRAVGYTAWVCTQVGQLDAVGRLRSFIPQRISLATRDSQTTNTFLGDGASAAGALCHQIRQPGVGYALNDSDRAAVKFRGALVADSDLRMIAAGTLPPDLIAHTRAQIGEVVGDHALYRWFDKDQQLLYVGITNDVGRRTNEHEEKPWWPEVASSQVEWFPSRKAALAAEKAAIEAEKPLFNTVHNTRNKRRIRLRKQDQRTDQRLSRREKVDAA